MPLCTKAGGRVMDHRANLPLRSGFPLLDVNGDMASQRWAGPMGGPGQTPRPPFPGKAGENLSAATHHGGPATGPRHARSMEDAQSQSLVSRPRAILLR